MKKALSLMLVFALALSLAACSGKSDTPAAPPAPTIPEPPAVTPVDPDNDEWKPIEFVAHTNLHNRLYGLTEDGGQVLLWGESGCSGFARDGDRLVAAFYDGTIREFDLSDGSSRLLMDDCRTVMDITLLEHGFIAHDFDFEHSRLFLWQDGEVTEFGLDRYLYNFIPVGGNRVIYTTWSAENNRATQYVYDLTTHEEVGELDLADVSSFFMQDGRIYLAAGGYGGESRDWTWYELDPDTLAASPAEVPLPTDMNDRPIYLTENGCLSFCYYSEKIEPGMHYHGTDGDARLEDADGHWIDAEDIHNGKVLLHRGGSDHYHSDTWDLDYSVNEYFVFDSRGLRFTKRDFLTEEGAMFAAGDYPVMDSSTARKPVTSHLYELFCLSPGVGGAEPLCSTTHGAWLNLADGKADIALLAAPTAEEEAYLQEKGAEIESKLYGGDGLVFIGSVESGVQDLTLEQVRAIYRGEITNWAQLGGADLEIHPIYRDDQSGSQRLFEKMLWKDEPVPDFEALGYARIEDMSTLVWMCQADPQAIGYSIMTYLSELKTDESLISFSLEGVSALPEHVADGSYPLSTRGYVVIRADESADSPARRLYNWFGSTICDEILTGCGVTPIK